MGTGMRAAIATAIVLASSPCFAVSGELVGRIESFECADNCYLTIGQRGNEKKVTAFVRQTSARLGTSEHRCRQEWSASAQSSILLRARSMTVRGMKWAPFPHLRRCEPSISTAAGRWLGSQGALGAEVLYNAAGHCAVDQAPFLSIRLRVTAA